MMSTPHEIPDISPKEKEHEQNDRTVIMLQKDSLDPFSMHISKQGLQSCHV